MCWGFHSTLLVASLTACYGALQLQRGHAKQDYEDLARGVASLAVAMHRGLESALWFEYGHRPNDANGACCSSFNQTITRDLLPLCIHIQLVAVFIMGAAQWSKSEAKRARHLEIASVLQTPVSVHHTLTHELDDVVHNFDEATHSLHQRHGKPTTSQTRSETQTWAETQTWSETRVHAWFFLYALIGIAFAVSLSGMCTQPEPATTFPYPVRLARVPDCATLITNNSYRVNQTTAVEKKEEYLSSTQTMTRYLVGIINTAIKRALTSIPVVLRAALPGFLFFGITRPLSTEQTLLEWLHSMAPRIIFMFILLAYCDYSASLLCSASAVHTVFQLMRDVLLFQ